MARRGLMTALQAALAGIGGAAGGYVQQQELERKRAAEKQALERQQMLDIESLRDRNWTSPEQYAKQREAGGDVARRVTSQALTSALSPRAAMAGITPVTPQDTSALTRALAMPETPPERMTYAGKEFVRGESPIQTTERMADIRSAKDLQNSITKMRAELQMRSEIEEQQREQTNKQDFETFKQVSNNPNLQYSSGVNWNKRLDVWNNQQAQANQRSMNDARIAAEEVVARLRGAADTDPTKVAQLSRLRAGVSEMRNSHDGMLVYEKALQDGKAAITANTQVLSALAKSFTSNKTTDKILSSVSMSALGKTDPQLYRYIRRGLSFAEGEMMVQNRPSDYRTRMATFLSMAAAGHSPESITDIQGRREAILNPLEATVPSFMTPSTTPAAPPPPLYRRQPTRP